MSLSPTQWHQRFSAQARWTADLRAYLFQRANLAPNSRILEVGCGTGAVLAELNAFANLHGLDLNPDYLRFTAQRLPAAHLVQADALRLPYSTAAFDLCVCHFLLLWVADARQVVSEMRRVTRPGGTVLALAEPDYGGRIDYPLELGDLGIMQAEALHDQGADIAMGRKLGELFWQAGLSEIETGVLGGQWHGAPTQEEWQSEWLVLADDLEGHFPTEQLQQLKEIDRRAWENASRVLYVPTFYACGIAKGKDLPEKA